MKRNVCLTQVNNTFGRSAFLPYSVGLLQAYAQADLVIRSEYEFKELFFLREPVDKVIARMNRPDVFGVSCYIWNWSYSTALARAVKEAFPECLIVLGGPHVPVKSEGFFKQHSWADVLIHYEGEGAFRDLLLERLKTDAEYWKVPGLTVKVGWDADMKTQQRERLADLSVLPSPYLDGVFDEILKYPYEFHASQETHRGCPYSCTFCDWGSNTMAKLKQIPDARLEEEFAWMARHRVDLLYNCDANYGIFARDVPLTEKIVKVKRDSGGCPNKFRAAYAKNSGERVFEIAKLLNEAGMNKGVTLSFQSMDDNTLEIVKRKNIKVQDFKGLMKRYREAGIATYSEIIIGLPGETYDTFANGLNKLLEGGQHDGLNVYTCEVLPNSEMNDSAYREKHGIETVKSPVLFYHNSPSPDPHREYYELVIRTRTLDRYDWGRCQMLSWAVQAFHCMNLTQAVAVFLHTRYGVRYRDFYEKLLDFASANRDTIVGRAYDGAFEFFLSIQRGHAFNLVDERFGDILWPPEEYAFLRCGIEDYRFYVELGDWLAEVFPQMPSVERGDILRYQQSVVWLPKIGHLESQFPLAHNVHEYLKKAYLNEPAELVSGDFRYRIIPSKRFNTLPDYAREVVWYGRKGGACRHSNIERII